MAKSPRDARPGQAFQDMLVAGDVIRVVVVQEIILERTAVGCSDQDEKAKGERDERGASERRSVGRFSGWFVQLFKLFES